MDDIEVPGLKFLGDSNVTIEPTPESFKSMPTPAKTKAAPDVADLQPDLLDRVTKLKDLWKNNKELNPKGEDLPITSGYRTLKQQREEYKNRLKNPNLVAAPGTSRHEKGDAVDIHPRVPDSLLAQVGLHRPYGSKDPVHVQINPDLPYESKVEPNTGDDIEVPGLKFVDTNYVKPEPEPWYKSFGKSTASLADTALGTVPAAAQFVAEPVAKLIDRVGNTKVAEEALNKVTNYFDRPVGKALGITQDPAYNAEATHRLMDFAGENVDKGAKYIANKTGMDESDAKWFINAALLKAAPTAAKGAVKTGEYIAQKAPVVGKALGDVTAATLGSTTGVGTDTVREAFKSGLYNRPEFWENLTGRADKMQVLNDAKEALQIMRDERLGSYSDKAVDVFQSPEIEAGKPIPKYRLDFQPIENKMNTLMDSIQEKGEKGVKYKVGEAELNKIKEVQEVVNDWKDDPSLHNVKGLDALKRRIDAIYPENPKQSQAQRIITGMRSQVKNEIIRQVPEYENLMKDYESSLELEKEIERTLSLGPKANPETALRKLQSITRNNVNTAYGYRGDLAKELEKRTGKNLISALSGQSMSTIAPRGLAGLSPVATLGAAFGLSPMAAAALPFESPGVVGAMAYGAGKAARKMTKLSELTSRK
jgi:D-alanyl-D-alanine carboxypeptidase